MGRPWCGVVHAEDAHSAPDPELEDGAELVPEAAPVGRLEVERVDVLVLLGRVLRVLDGAVGTVQEPVGVFLYPRVVGRALEGDIEGNLHAVGVGGGDEMIEVGEGAELGMDGFVAAFRGPDGPGTAWVFGTGGYGVVGAFAVGEADRVYGRQVQDVEAHGGDVGQERFDIGEGAVARGIGGCRAGEELVPTGEAGALAVDPEAQLLGFGGKAEVGIAVDEGFDLGRERVLVEGELFRRQRAQGGSNGFDAFGVGGLRFFSTGGSPGGGLVEELRADLKGQGNVLRREVAPGGVGGIGLGGEALLEVVAPGVEVVHPGLDGVCPGTELVDGEAGGPHVVDQRGHGRGAPGRLALVLVEQARGDVVVAVREDGGGDRYLVAYEPACGVTAAIDLRLDGFDEDSLTAFFGFHFVSFTRLCCISFICIGTRRRLFPRSMHLTEELFLLNIGIDDHAKNSNCDVQAATA